MIDGVSDPGDDPRFIFENVHGGLIASSDLIDTPLRVLPTVLADWTLYYSMNQADLLGLVIREGHTLLDEQWREILRRTEGVALRDFTDWTEVEGWGWLFSSAVVTMDDPFA